jgi:uncharacterized protein (DUF1800 family)
MGTSVAGASWSEEHVRRLFWRAGFGATPEEARKWARRGQEATVRWFLDGDGRDLRGPSPRVEGVPLDPVNEFGHDVLWWLDRMVRSMRPLVEKMTLFWHDHFACKDQTPLMLAQNRQIRQLALGDFRSLLRAITVDPAMQRFLSLAGSNRRRPNENYARELMELFTLGSGYSEDDVREAARALTGFRAPRDGRTGLPVVQYDPARHDPGAKTIFGRTGAWDWQDVLELTVTHPSHAPFLVSKLWAFFVTAPIDPATQAGLERVYVSSGLQIKPVLGAILRHPALYRSLGAPDMVKSPVVYVAGALRTTGRRVDLNWSELLEDMGMRLFAPPSVAGWEWGPAWLSTNAMRARFDFASALIARGPAAVRDGSAPRTATAAAGVAQARAALGAPWVSGRTNKVLRNMAAAWGEPRRPKKKKKRSRRGGSRPLSRTQADTLQRALRHLLVSGSDGQLH